MLASKPQETPLPRAIIRQSAALKAKYGGPVNKLETEPSTPVGTTPVETPGTTAESSAAPNADPRENDPAHWKQRFNVTSGILRAEREDRKVQFGLLNQRITELEAQLQAARDAVPEPQGDLGEFFTPEQIEEMGEDTARATYNAIKKQVKAELAKVVETQIKPLQTARQNQQEDERQARVQAFTDRLEELIPGYAEIDASEDWQAWLAEENKDGLTRQDVLNKHTSVLNAERTAAMFTEFLKGKKRPEPPITPNGSGATPPSAPAKQTVLTAPTRAEIKTFFTRKALNKVSKEEIAVFEERMKLV